LNPLFTLLPTTNTLTTNTPTTMKYILSLMIWAGIGSLHLYGQAKPIQLHGQAKINVDLMAQYIDCEPDSLPFRVVGAIAKGDAQAIKQLAAETNTHCKWCVTDFCALNMPLSDLPIFINSAAVSRIEAHRGEMQKLDFPDDSIHLSHNNITPAHQGAGDLPTQMRGAGVLLSIIDDGFDWKHPDFQLPDSSTRVQFLWDQALQSVWGEQQFGYGSVWNKQNIDDNLCHHIPNTHGIHVAGIAGGNGRAANKFLGVAPEADFLWVRVGSGGGFLSQFTDAVYWSALKADELNMPCAINSSVGSYTGAHDGKDLYSQAIAAILRSRTGFALAQAAGNARASTFHIGTTLQGPQDTARTWFEYHAGRGATHFIIYADTNDFQNINFSLENIDFTSSLRLSGSQTYNIGRDFYTPDNSSSRYQDVFYYFNNGAAVALDVQVGNYAGVYEIWIQIQSPMSNNYWQLTTSGVGKFDIWSAEELTGTSDIVPQAAIPKYVAPDNEQSIVGYWTCVDEVVTVASYQNQTYMINYAGDSLYLGTPGFEQGGISQFSSLGMTRDGRQKPDITASGGQVMSASPVSNLFGYRASFLPNLDEAGWHVSNRGTSMSAPFVAGALALYFQCKPNATNAEIHQALRQSARLDSFVFVQSPSVPNRHWGYGKLDVYGLLLQCLHYGCTDTLADNFDPVANVDNGGCLYLPSSIQRVGSRNALKIYPNPSNNLADIRYEVEPKYVGGKIDLYSSDGRLLSSQIITSDSDFLRFGATADLLGQQVYWLVLSKHNLPTQSQAVFLLPR
jgi:subtilisin family serine protease